MARYVRTSCAKVQERVRGRSLEVLVLIDNLYSVLILFARRRLSDGGKVVVHDFARMCSRLRQRRSSRRIGGRGGRRVGHDAEAEETDGTGLTCMVVEIFPQDTYAA